MYREKNMNKWARKMQNKKQAKNIKELKHVLFQMYEKLDFLTTQNQKLNENLTESTANIHQKVANDYNQIGEKLDLIADELAQTHKLMRIIVANELIDELDT